MGNETAGKEAHLAGRFAHVREKDERGGFGIVAAAFVGLALVPDLCARPRTFCEKVRPHDRMKGNP